MVVTGGSTNARDLTVQNDGTYTVRIQTLTSTELPSQEVDVPYQGRTGQLHAVNSVGVFNYLIVCHRINKLFTYAKKR